MGYLLRTQQARRQFMYGAALVDVVPRLLYHHVRLEKEQLLKYQLLKKIVRHLPYSTRFLHAVSLRLVPLSCRRCHRLSVLRFRRQWARGML